jgi:hypothetical protein
MPQDFNAEKPGRPGVSVGEDLADQLLAATFRMLQVEHVASLLRAMAIGADGGGYVGLAEALREDAATLSGLANEQGIDQAVALHEAGDGLAQWVKAKQASPHQAGEDGHRDGFCRRCADLYVAGNQAVIAWEAARQQEAPGHGR